MGLPNLPHPCFGPDELGLYLGCYGWTRAWRGALCAFGLADGTFGPFIYPYQELKMLGFYMYNQPRVGRAVLPLFFIYLIFFGLSRMKSFTYCQKKNHNIIILTFLV